MDQYNIGNFIQKKRREKNLTQEQLAERLGVSNKTVSKWENGKCLPDYSVIELLCKELGVTVAELLCGKANNTVEDSDDERDPKDNHLKSEDDIKLLLYRIHQWDEKRKNEYKHKHNIKTGVTFGSALAIVISYVHWHSVGWAILHGLLSWVYVIYYILRY